MPDYNPHSPQILGQEYLAVRDENLTFDPFANTFERGYSFTLNSTQAVDNAHVYLNTFPGKFFYNDCLTVNIYPRGAEDRSGPIRRVIIPCNAAIVTGSSGGYPLSAVAFGGGATTGPDAVWNPSGLQYLDIRVGELYTSRSSFFFDVNRYSNLLNGKRILGVNFLTTIDVGSTISNGGNDQGFLRQGLGNTATINGSGGTVQFKYLATPQTPSTTLEFVRVRLGDVNPFYGVAGLLPLTNYAGDVSQWTYAELQRFEFSASNAMHYAIYANPVGIQSGSTNYIVSYAALEVYFCDEARVGFGTKIFNFDFVPASTIPYKYGANVVRLRNPSATGLILPTGDYTVTVSGSNMGENLLTLQDPGNNPLFNELRVPEEFPTVPGVEVALPYPLDDFALGTTITAESTMLIPQISLHASGSALTTLVDPHGYGRLTRAQIWGTITATQNVDDSVSRFGSAKSWPWVRYYARRFGDTTAPLRLDCITPAVSGSGTFVQITPTEFDALDEIVDGWKEITLRFGTSPSMGSGTSATWRWSANSELVGNRWEVLGVAAPAVSGRNTWLNIDIDFAPTAQRLDTTTYDSAAAGSTFRESWMPWNGPYQTVTTADTTADATLIFSQDPPTVAGFAGVTLTQPLATFEDCGNEACCVPTALLYNRLTWTAQSTLNPGNIVDTFSTDYSSSWGFTDNGFPFTTSGGSASDYSVSGGAGKISLPATNSTRRTLVGSGIRDSDQIVAITVPALALTQTINVRLVARFVDGSNLWNLKVEFATDGTVDLSLNKTVASVSTFPASGPNATTYTAGSIVYVRFQVIGDTFRAKAWQNVRSAEPAGWAFEYSEAVTALTVGPVGFISDLTTGNTNTLPFVISFDDYTVTTPATYGSMELQRMDSITDWQTIMLSTSPYVTGFSDYEARISLTSSYRIRVNNALDFNGPWSSTVTVPLISPGVSGGSCINDGHLLTFTTNEVQDGTSNLAYSNAWENDVVEDFSFPEAGFTQFQAMYGRDFFTAFRPMERGGEQFSRNILVSAAAISPETLADFVDLRDLAWDDVPYVCVRDEDGNRWFASISVPAGNVRNRRKLYIANVQVTEITDTPSPVDA